MIPSNALKVLIAEDHDIVRRCLCLAIARRSEFQVVGEASTGAEAREKAERLRPDVVVVDVYLPDATGVETARAIRSRHPEVGVLVLTPHGDNRAVISAIMAGALGYLDTKLRSREIADAVRRAGQGQHLLDRSVVGAVLARLMGSMAQAEADAWRLTPLEARVLDLVVRGSTDREIAQQLELSEGRVAQLVGHILGKLEMVRRAQAGAYLAGRRAQRALS